MYVRGIEPHLLTNHEVASLIAAEGPVLPAASRRFLGAVHARCGAPYDSAALPFLLQQLQPFQLEQAEVLQLLNLRPTSLSVLHAILDCPDDRFPDDQLVALLALVGGLPGHRLADPFVGAPLDLSWTKHRPPAAAPPRGPKLQLPLDASAQSFPFEPPRVRHLRRRVQRAVLLGQPVTQLMYRLKLHCLGRGARNRREAWAMPQNKPDQCRGCIHLTPQTFDHHVETSGICVGNCGRNRLRHKLKMKKIHKLLRYQEICCQESAHEQIRAVDDLYATHMPAKRKERRKPMDVTPLACRCLNCNSHKHVAEQCPVPPHHCCRCLQKGHLERYCLNPPTEAEASVAEVSAEPHPVDRRPQAPGDWWVDTWGQVHSQRGPGVCEARKLWPKRPPQTQDVSHTAPGLPPAAHTAATPELPASLPASPPLRSAKEPLPRVTFPEAAAAEPGVLAAVAAVAGPVRAAPGQSPRSRSAKPLPSRVTPPAAAAAEQEVLAAVAAVAEPVRAAPGQSPRSRSAKPLPSRVTPPAAAAAEQEVLAAVAAVAEPVRAAPGQSPRSRLPSAPPPVTPTPPLPPKPSPPRRRPPSASRPPPAQSDPQSVPGPGLSGATPSRTPQPSATAAAAAGPIPPCHLPWPTTGPPASGFSLAPLPFAGPQSPVPRPVMGNANAPRTPEVDQLIEATCPAGHSSISAQQPHSLPADPPASKAGRHPAAPRRTFCFTAARNPPYDHSPNQAQPVEVAVKAKVEVDGGPCHSDQTDFAATMASFNDFLAFWSTLSNGREATSAPRDPMTTSTTPTAPATATLRPQSPINAVTCRDKQPPSPGAASQAVPLQSPITTPAPPALDPMPEHSADEPSPVKPDAEREDSNGQAEPSWRTFCFAAAARNPPHDYSPEQAKPVEVAVKAKAEVDGQPCHSCATPEGSSPAEAIQGHGTPGGTAERNQDSRPPSPGAASQAVPLQSPTPTPAPPALDPMPEHSADEPTLVKPEVAREACNRAVEDPAEDLPPSATAAGWAVQAAEVDVLVPSQPERAVEDPAGDLPPSATAAEWSVQAAEVDGLVPLAQAQPEQSESSWAVDDPAGALPPSATVAEWDVQAAEVDVLVPAAQAQPERREAVEDPAEDLPPSATAAEWSFQAAEVDGLVPLAQAQPEQSESSWGVDDPAGALPPSATVAEWDVQAADVNVLVPSSQAQPERAVEDPAEDLPPSATAAKWSVQAAEVDGLVPLSQSQPEQSESSWGVDDPAGALSPSANFAEWDVQATGVDVLQRDLSESSRAVAAPRRRSPRGATTTLPAEVEAAEAAAEETVLEDREEAKEERKVQRGRPRRTRLRTQRSPSRVVWQPPEVSDAEYDTGTWAGSPKGSPSPVTSPKCESSVESDGAGDESDAVEEACGCGRCQTCRLLLEFMGGIGTDVVDVPASVHQPWAMARRSGMWNLPYKFRVEQWGLWRDGEWFVAGSGTDSKAGSAGTPVEFHSHPAVLAYCGWPNLPSIEDVLHLAARTMHTGVCCAELVITPTGLIFLVVSRPLRTSLLKRGDKALSWFKHYVRRVSRLLDDLKHRVGYRRHVKCPSGIGRAGASVRGVFCEYKPQHMNLLETAFAEVGISFLWWTYPALFQ